MVTAFVSHHSGLGLNPEGNSKCGLSLLLVFIHLISNLMATGSSIPSLNMINNLFILLINVIHGMYINIID